MKPASPPKHSATVSRESQHRNEGNTPMTTITDNEWRSFLTAGTRLAHIASPAATGDPTSLRSASSSTATNSPSPYPLGASKAKAWHTIGASHFASAMSGNPTASSPSKEKRRSPPSQTRSNTSPHASPTATTPPDPQRTSLNHSYRQASPQFGSASPTSSHDPASADTPTSEESENDGRLRQESSNTRTGEMK